MNNSRNFYANKVVYKPWGYEYVIYNDNNKIAITLVKINFGHKTSLHCHPKKKTGFIILEGNALVQIGLYKENSKVYKPLSRLVLRPGLFHSIKSLSKKGVYAFEFETPFKKKDLIRFKDNYGRQKKDYEGRRFAKNLDSNFIKFKKPQIGKKKTYKFNNLEILLEKKKNLKSFSKRDSRSSTAILNGKIVDKNGQNVISFGEIVKTSTLRILADKFEIKKPITVLKVSKNINNHNKKNYKFI